MNAIRLWIWTRIAPIALLLLFMTGCHLDPAEFVRALWQNEIDQLWSPERSRVLEETVRERLQNYLQGEARNACADWRVDEVEYGDIPAVVEVLSYEVHRTRQGLETRYDCLIYMDLDLNRQIRFRDDYSWPAEDIHYEIDAFQVAWRGLVTVFEGHAGPARIEFADLQDLIDDRGLDRLAAGQNHESFQEQLDRLRSRPAGEADYVIMNIRMDISEDPEEAWYACLWDFEEHTDLAILITSMLDVVIEFSLQSLHE